MPIGDFYLRDPATDVDGVWREAGPVEGWSESDPDVLGYLGFGPAQTAPGLIVICRRQPEYWTTYGEIGCFRIAKSAVNLAQILRAQIGGTSQHFIVRDSREVDILVPFGAKVRYRVGSSPAEHVPRTSADSLSTLITGSGSAVEVPLQRGDVLHMVADSTQATPVEVELRFVLFHGD